MPYQLSYQGKQVLFGGSRAKFRDDRFRFTIKTDEPFGNGDLNMQILTKGTDPYDFKIYWGDGVVEQYSGITPAVTHEYSSHGVYKISIEGVFPAMNGESNLDYSTKIISVENLGSVGWKDLSQSFSRISGGIYEIDTRKWKPGDNNISGVTNMNRIFYSARRLKNIDLTGLDTSNVTSMELFFYRCGDIDAQPFNITGLETLDTGKVETLYNAFGANTNSDWSGIRGWDISSLKSMRTMFAYQNATDNYYIQHWDVRDVENMTALFLNNTSLSTENYDAILENWSSLPYLQNNVSVDFGSAKYTPNGDASIGRDILTNTYGWTVSDGGPA